MFVPKQILKAVCFVCEYSNGKYSPVGTAFFMGVPIPNTNPERWTGIVVTALHVIAEIEKRRNRIFLRVNTKDGGFDHVEMPFDEWIRPDQSEGILDATAAWFPHDNVQKYDFMYLAEEHVATTELLNNEDIGIGDYVFLAGLFVNHAGDGKNEPIVRSGTIAAIPSEEVLTTQGYMRAYLIESRSIGGLSGSPVFVDSSLFRQDASGNIQARPPGSRAWYLIGIIRGHWDTPDTAVPVEDEKSGERINMGIAIVTPFERALPLVHEALARRLARIPQDIADLIKRDPSQILRALAEAFMPPRDE